MSKKIMTMAAAFVLFNAGLVSADTLRLRDGKNITGTYLGGDTRTVKFIGSDGTAREYSVRDVASIDFLTGVASAPAPAPTPVPSSSVAATSSSSSESGSRSLTRATATVPGGTVISIRMIDSIDADVTAAGERFRASIDDPVTVDGMVVIPRNADASVQIARVEQAGAISGSDEVALKLHSIVVDGKTYELATNYAEVKGEGQGKRTAKTTAVTTGIGAVVGGIIGGGKGAMIGAGAGAGTGVAVSAARGKTLRIPSESRLDFVLRAPLAIEK
jgi:hypothetical protein